MTLQHHLIFLVLTFLTILFIGNVEANEDNITISSIKYTNDLETGEEVILVGNGKDYGTIYNYKIYDDDDDQYRSNDDNDDCDVQNCLPPLWYTAEFDDSDWNRGAAPFGDEEMDGIIPGTIWESDEGSDPGVLNDNLVIRHYFNYTKEDNVLSATLKIVHNNYYVAYLNGELIRNCYYYNYHDDCYERNPEYWKTNGDNFLTYDGTSQSGPNPEWLVDGENLLAILVYDHCCYQGDPHQWIDAELVINVQSWKDKPIILGDELALGIDFFNNEDYDVENINISLEIDGEYFSNNTVSIPSNQTYEWILDWIPTRLGDINVTAKVLDKTFTRSIHIGYYAYSLNFLNTQKVTEINKTVEYQFNIKNEGDVNDNFTFDLEELPDGWDYSFSPSIATLKPNESIDIKLNVTISNNAQAGNYSIFPMVFSQYYSQKIETLVESGISNSTQYTYEIWNNSDFPDDFYKIDYNVSEWSIGSAPFGNEELRGITPNTIWLTEDKNYTHIGARHWFNYSGDLDFSDLKLRVAHDDYFRVYLNGNLVRDCFSSWGCEGDGRYWEETMNIDKSWLNEGQNLIAIAVRDNTQGWGGGDGSDGRQWLDQELEVSNLKSKLWGFQEIYEELIISVNETYDYEILTPITTKEVEDNEPYEFTVWILNRGNVKDTYNITVSLNDTENFNIISYNDEIEVPYGSDGNIELIISLNENIDQFNLAEFSISVRSKNSTTVLIKETTIYAKLYIPPDLVAPATYAMCPELVNSPSFDISWNVESWYKENLESGNDTKYVIIEYSTDNGTNGETWSDWEIWSNISSRMGSTKFTEAKHNHQYRFRSVGGDDDGKIEDKEDKYDNVTFVDLIAPEIYLDIDLEENFTNQNWIEIYWTAYDNNEIITHYDFYYKIVNQSWILEESNMVEKDKGFYTDEDGIYQFMVVGYDLAGNQGFSISESIHIDTKEPTPIITDIPSVTDSTTISINLENKEDITNLTLFYKLNKEDENNLNSIWEKYDDYLINDLPLEVNVQEGYEYQFQILAYDLARNHGNSNIIYVIVDQEKPEKVKNLKLAEGKTITNSSIDISISFTASPSLDLIEYRIYRSITSDDKGEIIVSIPSGEQYLSYKDENVLIGKTYHYSVVAVDRMNFESDEEKVFVNLTSDIDCCAIDDGGKEEDSSLPTILIGLAIIGSTAGIIAFIGRKTTEEIVHVVGDIVENNDENITGTNFTETDGELLCNSCGAMFSLGEDSCPSCGILNE